MAALGRAFIARIESSIIPSMPNKVRGLWFHDAGEWNLKLLTTESHHRYNVTHSCLLLLVCTVLMVTFIYSVGLKTVHFWAPAFKWVIFDFVSA